MANIALKAEKRIDKEIKKNAAAKLGREGYIPAVIYGLEKKPESIKVERKELIRLLKGHNISSIIFDVSLDGKGKDSDAVIIKEYQRDPISSELSHLDFLRIQMKKEIETSVPISILNSDIAVGIKDMGGVLQHGLRELHISCLPSDIPEHIDYDIGDLEMNGIVRVENIEIDGKVRILNEPSEVIVSIIPPTELKEEEPAAGEAGAEEMEEPELVGREKPAEEAAGGEAEGHQEKAREE
jgi:large subunit ribosomal protein L25